VNILEVEVTENHTILVSDCGKFCDVMCFFNHQKENWSHFCNLGGRERCQAVENWGKNQIIRTQFCKDRKINNN
jgi:hypothetical protein